MTSLLRALFQLGTSDDERWKDSLRDTGAGPCWRGCGSPETIDRSSVAERTRLNPLALGTAGMAHKRRVAEALKS